MKSGEPAKGPLAPGRLVSGHQRVLQTNTRGAILASESTNFFGLTPGVWRAGIWNPQWRIRTPPSPRCPPRVHDRQGRLGEVLDVDRPRLRAGGEEGHPAG